MAPSFSSAPGSSAEAEEIVFERPNDFLKSSLGVGNRVLVLIGISFQFQSLQLPCKRSVNLHSTTVLSLETLLSLCKTFFSLPKLYSCTGSICSIFNTSIEFIHSLVVLHICIGGHTNSLSFLSFIRTLNKDIIKGSFLHQFHHQTFTVEGKSLLYFVILLPQILDNFQNQFDQVLAEIFEVKDKHQQEYFLELLKEGLRCFVY